MMTETNDFVHITKPSMPVTPAQDPASTTSPAKPSATHVLINLQINPDDTSTYPVQWIQYLCWICLVKHNLRVMEKRVADKPPEGETVIPLTPEEYKWTKSCLDVLDKIKPKAKGNPVVQMKLIVQNFLKRIKS
jgi:hypothetical protein